MKMNSYIACVLVGVLFLASGCTGQIKKDMAALEVDNTNLESQLENAQYTIGEQEKMIDDLNEEVRESNSMIKTALEDMEKLQKDQKANPINHFIETMFDGEILYKADSKEFAYIDYVGFETVGNIFIGDAETGLVEQITNFLTDGSDLTVKKIMWTSSGRLLAIVGYAYGTLTQGGSVYDVNNETGEMTLIYEPAEGEEVIDMIESGHGSKLTLLAIRFDENYQDYETFTLDYNMEEVNELIDGLTY